MKPLTAAILASGLVIAVLVWAMTVLLASSYQVVRVENNKPLIYLINTRSGDMKLCGPEACVPIQERVPQAAQNRQ